MPVGRSGEGSGLQSTARQVGSALGIAILGTVLFTTAGARLDTGLAEVGVPQAARTAVVNAVVESAGGAIPGLAADPRTASAAPVAAQAFSEATRYAAFTAAGFLVLGLLATFSLGDPRRGRQGQDREGQDREGQDLEGQGSAAGRAPELGRREPDAAEAPDADASAVP